MKFKDFDIQELHYTIVIKVIWLLMSDDLSLYIFSELKLNAKVKTEIFSASKMKVILICINMLSYWKLASNFVCLQRKIIW